MTDSYSFHQLRLLTPADPPLKSVAAAVEPRTCFVSERRPNKTAFLWFDESVSAEMRPSEGSHSLGAPHHPHAVYRPLDLTLTISAGCVLSVCVHVWKCTCGLVGSEGFPALWTLFPLSAGKNPPRPRKRVVWASRLCWWLLCQEYLDSQMLLATFFSSMVARKQTNWRFWS